MPDPVQSLPPAVAAAAQREATLKKIIITVWSREVYRGQRQYSWTVAGEAAPDGYTDPQVFHPL